MEIKFWGVRGSTPTPQPENLRYGGNTSCVEVRVNGSRYIFDCGTGFRVLGKEMLRQSEGKPMHAHVFISHFHWDHIQGIPFFGPLYNNPDNYFFFHSTSRSRGLQRALEEQMMDPYFPVNMSAMQGHRNWREAVDIAMGSGAKELVLFHHDPDHTDTMIDKIVTDARNYYPKVRAAAEGMEIKL